MPISPAERFEEAVGGHWRASLAHEDMAQPSRLIAPELAQCADFDAAQWLYAVVAAFAADYLQSVGFEVDLIPAQSHELTAAQPVPVSHQDHGGVTLPVATPLSRRVA